VRAHVALRGSTVNNPKISGNIVVSAVWWTSSPLQCELSAAPTV
jgi:hypothetical protein